MGVYARDQLQLPLAYNGPPPCNKLKKKLPPSRPSTEGDRRSNGEPTNLAGCEAGGARAEHARRALATFCFPTHPPYFFFFLAAPPAV